MSRKIILISCMILLGSIYATDADKANLNQETHDLIAAIKEEFHQPNADHNNIHDRIRRHLIKIKTQRFKITENGAFGFAPFIMNLKSATQNQIDHLTDRLIRVTKQDPIEWAHRYSLHENIIVESEQE